MYYYLVFCILFGLASSSVGFIVGMLTLSTFFDGEVSVADLRLLTPAAFFLVVTVLSSSSTGISPLLYVTIDTLQSSYLLLSHAFGKF